MESLLGLLPLVLFLACPLLMVACFVGMRRMDHASEPAPAAAVSDPILAEQVAALQAQLQQLQQQQTAIAHQLGELTAALAADPVLLPDGAPAATTAKAYV